MFQAFVNRLKKLSLWIKFGRLKKRVIAPVYHNWSQYIDTSRMPTARYQALQVAEQQIEWNLPKEELIQSIDAVILKLVDKQPEDAKALLLMLRERISLILANAVVRQLIATFYIYKGEDPNEYSEDWTAKKIAILEKDKEAYHFFFIEFFTKFKKLELQYAKDLLNYLSQLQIMEKGMKNIMSRFIGGSTNSTKNFSNQPTQ